jgi:nitroreductase
MMLPDKRAVSSVPLHDLLAARWSPRAYDRDQPVAGRDLRALLEAARWAPSCFGDEPWHYLVWDRSSDSAQWEKAYACLSEKNRSWVKNAPVLMLSVAASTYRHNGAPNRFAEHDTGAASMAIALQAVALGMMAHQMGGFDADKARATFAIPPEATPMAMIAVGYPASADVLEGELKERELAPRKRRAIEENFFAGSWGKPFGL